MEFYDKKKNCWRKLSTLEKLTFYHLRDYYFLFESSYDYIPEELEKTTINQTIYFKHIYPNWLTPIEFAIIMQSEPLLKILLQKKYMLNIVRTNKDNNDIFHYIFRYTKNPILLNTILTFLLTNLLFDCQKLLTQQTTLNKREPLQFAICNNTFEFIEKETLQFFLKFSNVNDIFKETLLYPNSRNIYILIENNITFSNDYMISAKKQKNFYENCLKQKQKFRKGPSFFQIQNLEEKLFEINQIIYYLEHLTIELLTIIWKMDTHDYSNYYQWLPKEISNDLIDLVKLK